MRWRRDRSSASRTTRRIGTIGTLSIGNPDLKARHSHNFDGSLEWYFDEGAMLSVAAFRKNIRQRNHPGADEAVAPITRSRDRPSIASTSTRRSTPKGPRPGRRADVCRSAAISCRRRSTGSASARLADLHRQRREGGARQRGADAAAAAAGRPLDAALRSTTSGAIGICRPPTSTTRNFLTDYGDSRALDLDQGASAAGTACAVRCRRPI